MKTDKLLILKGIDVEQVLIAAGFRPIRQLINGEICIAIEDTEAVRSVLNENRGKFSSTIFGTTNTLHF